MTKIPSWASDLFAALVVVVVYAVPMVGPGPRHPMPNSALQLLEPAALVLAVALIPLRRRWPVPALAVAMVLYCATAVFGAPSTAVGIVAVIAAYSVGARTSRVETLLAGGVATALVALLSVTTSTFGVVDPRVFQIAAGIAVAAALGDSSRSHRDFLLAATERAERAEQTREAEAQQRVAEERLRIAQDLHDTVAHQISVISLNAGVASGALDKNPEKARSALGTIRTSSREVLSEIGELLRYLRTDVDPAVPQPGLGDIEALVARVSDSGLSVELRRSGDLARVSGTLAQLVYRIVQEGLTNAHKHGSGRSCSVRIEVGEEDVTVAVSNPVSPEGRNQPEPPRGGLGLTGIRERVASARGEVRIEEGDGSFAVIAVLPLRREAAAGDIASAGADASRNGEERP